MIIWLTGQPNSGKTTTSNHLRLLIPNSFVVDGDSLRDITKNYNYSLDGRLKNINDAQIIASYIHSINGTVIVAMVSPYRNIREKFKSKFNILEIYLTSNRIGKEEFKLKTYEPPLENFHHIDTDKFTVDEVCKNILNLIDQSKQSNIITP